MRGSSIVPLCATDRASAAPPRDRATHRCAAPRLRRSARQTAPLCNRASPLLDHPSTAPFFQRSPAAAPKDDRLRGKDIEEFNDAPLNDGKNFSKFFRQRRSSRESRPIASLFRVKRSLLFFLAGLLVRSPRRRSPRRRNQCMRAVPERWSGQLAKRWASWP